MGNHNWNQEVDLKRLKLERCADIKRKVSFMSWKQLMCGKEESRMWPQEIVVWQDQSSHVVMFLGEEWSRGRSCHSNVSFWDGQFFKEGYKWFLSSSQLSVLVQLNYFIQLTCRPYDNYFSSFTVFWRSRSLLNKPMFLRLLLKNRTKAWVMVQATRGREKGIMRGVFPFLTPLRLFALCPL